MLIVIFSRIYGQSIWTIGYIIIQMGTCFGALRLFQATLNYFYNILCETTLSLHALFGYLSDLNHVTTFEPYNDIFV